MKITEEIFNIIKTAANENNVEIGGILGGTEADTVSDIVLDIHNEGSVGKYSYAPDADFLNSKIAEWQNEEKRFLGIFHTHFFGICELSEKDKEYIKEIMSAMPASFGCLYFPVYTMPEQVLNVYTAKSEYGETVFAKEELTLL